MTDDFTNGRFAGHRFREQSLEGADFSGADLRGADFSGADMRGADFHGATFGAAPRIGAVLLGGAIAISIAAGVTIGWAVDQVRGRVYGDQWNEVAGGGSMVVVLLAFVGLILWRGFDTAIKASVVLYLVVAVGNVLANLVWDRVEWGSLLRSTLVLVTLFLAILAGILGRLIGGVFGSWSIALVAVLGALASGRAHGGVAGIIVALCLVAISKRAIRGDRRDRSLLRVAHRLTSRWDTQFVGADLTGADFTGVDGRRCRVKGATLVDVTWDPGFGHSLDLPDDAIPS
jgi:uncharacterized protein YjbI with pentapeptide repeats